jgi:hypothetical protein
MLPSFEQNGCIFEIYISFGYVLNCFNQRKFYQLNIIVDLNIKFHQYPFRTFRDETN